MINWKPIPALRPLIPMCLGILLATSGFVIPQLSLIVILIPSIIVLFYVAFKQKIDFANHKWFGGLMFVVLYLIGNLLVYAHDDVYKKDYFAQYLTSNHTDKLLVQIDDLPSKSKRIKLVGKVLQCNENNAEGHILMYLDIKDNSLQLTYGDIIAFSGQPKPIVAHRNPEAFDFQNMMKLRNVHYATSIANNEYQLVARQRGNPIMHLAYDLQNKLLFQLSRYLTEEGAFSVGSALILGYRSEISEEILDAYANTGATHVLSVSGLHVGLVATLFGYIIRKIKTSHKFWKILEPLLQIIFVWGFALVTGASSCVLRAAVMFSFIIVGKSMSRYVNTYNSLAISAFLLLIYNPYFLFDLSFQLSYLGLLGILYFYSYIYTFGVSQLSFIPKYWLTTKIWELTAVSMAAMITTTPISIYYFHQFPIYFWLSGLIVVPLATGILYIGLLLLLVSYFPILAQPIGKLLEILVNAMNWLLLRIEDFPMSVVNELWIDRWSVLLCYIMVAALGLALYKKQVKWLRYALVVLVVLLLKYNVSKIEHAQQRHLVLYEVGKETLLDIFEGENVVAIQSPQLSSSTIEFAAANNRWSKYCAANTIQTYNLSDTIQNEVFLLKNNFIKYKNTTLLFLQSPNTINDITEKTPIDFVVLGNNLDIDFDMLTQKIIPKTIILAASNKPKYVEFYKKQCETYQLAYFDMKRQGAFEASLK